MLTYLLFPPRDHVRVLPDEIGKLANLFNLYINDNKVNLDVLMRVSCQYLIRWTDANIYFHLFHNVVDTVSREASNGNWELGQIAWYKVR